MRNRFMEVALLAHRFVIKSSLIDVQYVKFVVALRVKVFLRRYMQFVDEHDLLRDK